MDKTSKHVAHAPHVLTLFSLRLAAFNEFYLDRKALYERKRRIRSF